MGQGLKINDTMFEGKFRYLDSGKDMSLEKKSRITASNTCYCGLKHVCISRAVSKGKTKIYKTI
jgi:hypothetical protein